MLVLTVIVALLQCLSIPVASDNVVHTPYQGHSFGTVLVSTIDGHLRALDTATGQIKWQIKEDPVLRAPSSIRQGFTFLPNPEDGSLYTLKEGSLKKLPFSIPQLVHASPCKGNDGVLYAGNKKDVWFGLDPETGHKVETLSSATTERVCPANKQHAVFIGRTEYHVSMFDIDNKNRSWNATFTDYSSHLLPARDKIDLLRAVFCRGGEVSADTAYPYQHFASSSSGQVLTVDTEGRVLWEKDLGQPIVAMYLLQNDGLHKLRYTVIGKETMENLVKNAFEYYSSWSQEDVVHKGVPSKPSLFSTLYVGECAYGLYALSAFVDEQTITFAPKYLGPPLIEAGSAIAIPEATHNPPQRRIVHIDYPRITTVTEEGEFLLLGYHETPQLYLGSIIPTKFPVSPIMYPWIGYEQPKRQIEEHPSKSSNSAPATDSSENLGVLLYQIYAKYPIPFYTILVSLLLLIVSTIWLCGRQVGVASVHNEARSAQTSRQSNSGKGWLYTRGDDIPDGWLVVGKVMYNPTQVLGRGCEGTVVYKGRFDGREVAVKRVVSEFVRFVDREVHLLRESDTHSHVIRYFCMESDSQFRYIALELCIASLNDYVEQPSVRKEIPLSPVEILRQATEGLTHLHAINIVHRDMKPQNVLLSMCNQKGQVRALISDFGLCKRVRPGRNSLSQRSGLAGTDGWIAPEALMEQSTSYPVDIFSIGCIFYFVLTGGAHPFGESLHRQMNIISGKHSLKLLSDDRTQWVALCLITQMISREPSERPSASAVLLHPFFWSPDRKLQFFGDVSDRVEKEDDSATVVQRLETGAKAVVCGNWRNQICTHLAEDLRKFRTYKGHSVRDLLRAMRNKKHHYRELPKEVRDSLGHIPEQFVGYFTTRFPLLLLHAYEALEWCCLEPVFRGYYSDETREKMRSEIERDEEERRKKADEKEVDQVWQRGMTTSKLNSDESNSEKTKLKISIEKKTVVLAEKVQEVKEVKGAQNQNNNATPNEQNGKRKKKK